MSTYADNRQDLSPCGEQADLVEEAVMADAVEC
jgi:hypothetical protein